MGEKLETYIHDTCSGHTKILQIAHNLEFQDVITGDGRGQFSINSGHIIIHKSVLELIKLDIVWRVVVGKDYFMITVSEPKRWKQIEGSLAGIVARHLPNE